ncbi:MAG: 3-isopropylmalate dehydratase small subunit [Pseudomonadota bacterium]|nr:3-isopropylmalate dehydratase small subunit [Pseudomonadota bacterium]
MQAFTSLSAVAAPMPAANVDTDKIIPARFLKTIKRSGLGKNLFDGLRYTPDGAERPDFVLNQPAYRNAEILIAHENFGCGSSREHAAWALLDFGIRCVIAPSFADIFHGNALKNGVLPVVLPKAVCDALMADAELGSNARITVDLERQVVIRPSGEEIPFDVDPMRRRFLLEGLDDIGQTLQSEAAISAYEAKQATAQPWAPGIAAI